MREICGAIYVTPSLYIIINYKLCEYLGAKIDSMFMATTKKAPSYTNKTLGKHDYDFKIEKRGPVCNSSQTRQSSESSLTLCSPLQGDSMKKQHACSICMQT